MSPAHLFLHNWRWKLFSILLATALWIYVRATLPEDATFRKNPLNSTAEFQNRLPIRILAASQAGGGFQLDPAEVEVTLRGDFLALQDLNWKEVQAWVDLTDINASRGAVEYERVVQVRGPGGAILVRIEPERVRVRREPAAEISKP